MMPDYNKILSPGDIDGGSVNTVVEISEGSMLKIEYRREEAVFELDRVEPAIFAKPTNYGFIPQTLDEDGDELDTLIISSEPLPTGVVVEGKIIGVMNFEDDGDMDHKILVVPADERNTGDAIQTLADLPEQWKKKVEHHFNHYKDLKKPGSTKVLGWGDIEEAKGVIKESIQRWNNKSR
jgi:inorganic pyrophosphatase